VQDVLQVAIAEIAGHIVALSCAGRTDTGVHATVQIAHFDTEATRPLGAWVRGVNAHLPTNVCVRWAQEVDEDFHARFSAYARRYRYVLLNRPVRPAILAGKVGWQHAPLNLPIMQTAAKMLIGEHDFSAFRAAQCQAKSPVRILTTASVTRMGDLIAFDFEANGFLHHMIRNLVGTLVFIGKGEAGSDWMGELLLMKDRQLAPPTFSPAGLYLCGVSYPDRWHLPGEGRIIGTPAIVL
jgi:tRNA pseudouridine38-40 synthase